MQAIPSFDSEPGGLPDEEAIPVVDMLDDLNDSMGNVLVVVNETLWKDFEKLKLKRNLKLHKESVLGISISDNCENVVSVSQDTQVKLFSAEDGQVVRSMNLSSMALSSCALMPDGKTVLIGSWDNNLYIYSVEYGRVFDTVNAHDDAVTIIRWSGDMLLTGSWDSTAKLWDFTPCADGRKPDSPSLLGEFEHDAEVTAADLLCVNGDVYVATGTRDGHVILWDADTFMVQRQNNTHFAAVSSVSFSQDAQRLFSCSADNWMKVTDISSGVEIYSKNVKEPIKCSCWDGQIVVLGLENGVVLIWDLMQIGCLKQLCGHEGSVNCASVSSDGTFLVTAGNDGYIKFWTVNGN